MLCSCSSQVRLALLCLHGMGMGAGMHANIPVCEPVCAFLHCMCAHDCCGVVHSNVATGAPRAPVLHGMRTHSLAACYCLPTRRLLMDDNLHSPLLLVVPVCLLACPLTKPTHPALTDLRRSRPRRWTLLLLQQRSREAEAGAG